MNKLLHNQSLQKGQFLESESGRFRLTFQQDGNVVLTLDGNPHGWSTDTYNRGADLFVFQPDGNAVVYASGQPLWSTNTYDKGATQFVLQDDGNLVVYAGNNGIWASNTWVSPAPPKIASTSPTNGATPPAENPLKLDDAWYCNCIGNGEAVLQSTQALAKFPMVTGILLSRNLKFNTEGLYASPYCGVPSMAQLEAEAIDRAMSFNCPRLWGASRCDNHRNNLRQQYLEEAKRKQDSLCKEAAKNEALLIESIATKAGTEVQTDIVQDNLSPEGRAKAEQEMQRKNAQMGWVLLGVLVGIGLLVWQIVKK